MYRNTFIFLLFFYFIIPAEGQSLKTDNSEEKIRALISDKKFSEAGEMLRIQLKLNSGDSILNLLQRVWVVEDYKANYVTTSMDDELDWNGSVNTCSAGNISVQAQKKFLQRLNYIRRLAGLPDECELREDWNRKCQEAALMMLANSKLSHEPQKYWKCFSASGKEGAYGSNLSLGEHSSDALMGQVEDDGEGNEAVGHRRWIFYPNTKIFGHGSTNSSMALWVFGGDNAEYPKSETERYNSQFVAWPPAGYVPFDFRCSRWSFSLAGADFSRSAVTIISGKKNIRNKILPEKVGYGLPTLVFEIDEMASIEPGVTYTVTIDHVKSIFLKNEKKVTYKIIFIRV